MIAFVVALVSFSSFDSRDSWAIAGATVVLEKLWRGI